MAIQNKKPVPKASSKTDAMKSLSGQFITGEAESTPVAHTAAKGVTVAPITTPSSPKPTITRKMPGGIIGGAHRDAEAEETDENTDADVTMHSGKISKSGSEKIAFDSMLWQWRELTEDFINTRTGDIRAQDAFINPDARDEW